MQKKLYKSTTDKQIDGVCGGIAEYFDIDATVIRLAWVLLTLIYGIGILFYIICCVVLPVNHNNTHYDDDDTIQFKEL
ncbi:PspC domain-containing protein [Clostridium sp. CM028]|uniref:PspC domain-containing protein n=1 Tax=Clostridium sp. CM028 TaxID=2851575 RepID=UPI001C6E2FBB|nr:PspC domain-containing protein [Clostridium sp. CM028]MBW9150275.1 PspC domain-containing protein [Clostridium sp. CM028]WLC62849.1 PspC domain-containing protein [Clostridium sp. CM028]